MIFPGMDPYLEDPLLWPGVHNRFIVYLAEILQPLIRPRYVANIEERIYMAEYDQQFIPDVQIRRARRAKDTTAVAAVLEAPNPVLIEVPFGEVHEPYVTIVDLNSHRKVVSVIEVVSPTNKHPGVGRESYLSKQADVRKSKAHLIEIDLLRTGHPVVAVPEHLLERHQPFNYLVSVNRAKAPRNHFEVYPIPLQAPLPSIAIPLAGQDPDAVLNLQEVLVRTYDAGVYGDTIDYRKPCRPALSAEEQTWAKQLIRKAKK